MALLLGAGAAEVARRLWVELGRARARAEELAGSL
jgi:hypothetical protein